MQKVERATLEALNTVSDFEIARGLQIVFHNRYVHEWFGFNYSQLLVSAHSPRDEEEDVVKNKKEISRLEAFCKEHPECSFETVIIPASVQLKVQHIFQPTIYGPLELVCLFLAPWVRIEMARIYGDDVEAAVNELQDCGSQTGFENVMEEAGIDWIDITDKDFASFAWNQLHPGYIWMVKHFNYYRWSNPAMREFCRLWDFLEVKDSEWKKQLLALSVKRQDPLFWWPEHNDLGTDEIIERAKSEAAPNEQVDEEAERITEAVTLTADFK